MAGNKMVDACDALLPEGTKVRYCWTAQKGLNPNWRFLSFWLLVANQGRIVAVTSDGTVALFDAGRFKFNFKAPKRLMDVFGPGDVDMGSRKGSWSKMTVGEEKLWVARRTYPVIDSAAQILGAGAGGPAPQPGLA